MSGSCERVLVFVTGSRRAARVGAKRSAGMLRMRPRVCPRTGSPQRRRPPGRGAPCRAARSPHLAPELVEFVGLVSGDPHHLQPAPLAPPPQDGPSLSTLSFHEPLEALQIPHRSAPRHTVRHAGPFATRVCCNVMAQPSSGGQRPRSGPPSRGCRPSIRRSRP